MEFPLNQLKISDLFVSQCSLLSDLKKKESIKWCEIMQWLQKAKIIVTYSQDIMLNDNTMHLSLFRP